MDGAADIAADVAAHSGAPARAELEDLASDAAEANPFFAPMLLEPALANLAGPDVACAALRDENGRLIGFAPLARHRGYSRLPVAYAATWMHQHCFFAAPLLRRGHERAALCALFEFADKTGAFFRLRHLDADGPVYAAALAAAAQTGRLAAPSQRYQRAALRGPLDAETYLAAAVGGKKRKEFRRQRNRLADNGEISFERLRADADLATWTDQFLALEAGGWKGRAGSALASDPASAAFFTQSLAMAQASGALQFCRLTCGGLPVAMIVNFFSGGEGYSFKIAYDEKFARFSPGVLLELELLGLLAKDPAFRLIDSCARADHPMIDSLWRERRTISALNISRRDTASKALFSMLMGLERAGERARRRKDKQERPDAGL